VYQVAINKGTAIKVYTLRIVSQHIRHFSYRSGDF